MDAFIDGALFLMMGTLLVTNQVHGLSDMKRLTKHLLDNYSHADTAGCPADSRNHHVEVQFGLGLLYVDSGRLVDTGRGYADASFSVWNKYSWNDILLNWDPEDFDGMTKTTMSIQKIWSPDIKLFNSLDYFMRQDKRTPAMVFYDGTVLWFTPAKLHTRCLQYNDKDWKCSMTFGSWAHNINEMDIHFFNGTQAVDVAAYVQTVEIVSNTAVKHERIFDNETYPTLEFILKIKYYD